MSDYDPMWFSPFEQMEQYTELIENGSVKVNPPDGWALCRAWLGGQWAWFLSKNPELIVKHAYRPEELAAD